MNNFKKWIFFVAVIYSILMIAIYLPERWSSDISNMKFSITSEDGYVFFESENQEIPNESYVILENAEFLSPPLVARKLDEADAYLGIVELRPGWEKAIKIAKLRSEKGRIFRVHMLKKGEYEKLRLNEKSFYIRLRRAVLERSIDLIVLRNVPENVATYAEVRLERTFKNLIVSRPSPALPPKIIYPIVFFAIALFLLSLSPALGILAMVVYIFSPSYGVSLGAITAMFPIYKFSKNKPFISFLLFLTLGILTSLSLSDFDHLNQLELFRGVKLSLLALPSLVLLRGLIENYKKLGDKRFLTLLGIALGAFIVYYIMRSGNYGLVTTAERRFRDFLDEIFIIRPRFKEVFGYIFLPMAFKKDSRYSFIYEFFGAIALASTFNTFCHIKMPIFVSIYRSFLGFALGQMIYFIANSLLKKS